MEQKQGCSNNKEWTVRNKRHQSLTRITAPDNQYKEEYETNQSSENDSPGKSVHDKIPAEHQSEDAEQIHITATQGFLLIIVLPRSHQPACPETRDKCAQLVKQKHHAETK